jgi:spoIIIJ-associated protein
MAKKSKTKPSQTKTEDRQDFSKLETIIEQVANELLDHLEIEAEVKISQGRQGLIKLQFETEEPGILIGYHGETLNSIQRLLGMMVYRQTDEWVRVLVEVNDYRQKRKENLERLAVSMAQKVKFSGRPQILSPMSSFERRIIHLALAEDAQVETVSEGEGKQRRVVVKLVDQG